MAYLLQLEASDPGFFFHADALREVILARLYLELFLVADLLADDLSVAISRVAQRQLAFLVGSQLPLLISARQFRLMSIQIIKKKVLHSLVSVDKSNNDQEKKVYYA